MELKFKLFIFIYLTSKIYQKELAEILNEVEEIEPLSLAELLNSSNWLHMRPYILPQGRCSFYRNNQIDQETLDQMLKDPQNEGWFDYRKVKMWKKYFELKNVKESKKEDDYESEQDEVEEEEEGEAEVAQNGPGLLSPIDEDQNYIPVGYLGLSKKQKPDSNSTGLPLWHIQSSTNILPRYSAVACVKNSRWPGAYALAKDT